MKVRTLLGLALLLILAGCAGKQTAGTGSSECEGVFAPHYEDSYFAVGESCVASAEILPGPGGLQQGSNDLQAILHNRMDQDITGAELSFSLIGPDGQEKELAATIREERGGLYSVRGLELPELEGNTLVLNMDKNTVTERILFDLDELTRTKPDMAARHKHGSKIMHGVEEVPEDLDTSRKVRSSKGSYWVSYSPPQGGIPLSDFHSWELSVTNTDGEPVEAVVTVNGDMPQHGHGLPTNPQVTALGNGRYRVDGFKFHMPGWWQVVVSVATAERHDRAVFNFILEP